MTNVMALKPFLARLADGAVLEEDEAREAFGLIMDGNATPSQIGAFLMALRVRGETVPEIAGAVSVMRERMARVRAPANAIDVVGTGGDGSGTYNVSTCAALVVAACGVPVAKHGNKALSSRSGAADVLDHLGIRTGLSPEEVEWSLAEAGIGFMLAGAHHSAMRHVGPSRVELGTRTVFNLLGPLANPAEVKRLLVGVFDPQWCEPLARVLGCLGAERAWVVHGDGLDEITTTGETIVAKWEDGAISKGTITPEDAGVPRASVEDLRGGDPADNAAALRAVLGGAAGAYRDIVILNAAAALVVADATADIRVGAERAAAAIDSGDAAQTLDRLIAVTNGPDR